MTFVGVSLQHQTKGDTTMTKLQKIQEFNRLVKMFQSTKDVKYYQQAMSINF